MLTRKPNAMLRLSIASALGIVVASCGGGRADTAESDEPAQNRPPVSVSVVVIAATNMTERLELSAVLQPWLEIDVASELGGRVEKVAFEEGQRIQEGAVLAHVGTRLLTAALEEAQAGLLGAQADYERTQKLFDRQAVPRQQLLSATARYETAKAQVAQAELRVEGSVVRAPISGVALNRELELGEVLSPGATVTTLNQVTRLKAEAGIAESDVVSFSVGGDAQLSLDAYPGEAFSGSIYFVGPAAVGPSRTFPVKVAMDNHAGRLRPGMLARLSLTKRHLVDVVVVDRDTLQERDSGSVAIVVENGVASVRPVLLGPAEGNHIVVEKGLEVGDLLIVSGQRGLIDGQEVAIVKRREAAGAAR
jgi:membrane fusion protein (multidrug efflux system)